MTRPIRPRDAVEPTGDDPQLLAQGAAPSGLELAQGAEPAPDSGHTPARAVGPTLRSGRLAGLPMWAAIWVVSWPVLGESFLTWLVGAVDTVVAAGLSRDAADAIGGAAYVAWLMGMVGLALGVGANALVARSVGKGRLAVANAAVGQAVLVALSLGAAVGLIVAIVAEPLGRMLGLTGEPLRLLVLYLRIVAFGTPALTVLESCNACLRGAGDAKRPLAVMVTINVINLVVSWSLAGADFRHATTLASGEVVTRTLIANPFPFHWGVAGIATGTVTAWVVGAIMVLTMLARGRGGVALFRRRLRPHWHTLRRIVRVGLPNFLETLGMWAGNFLVVMMVGAMRTEGALGAHIVAIRIEAVSFLPAFSMSLAAATLAGQWLGAGSAAMASRVILACVGVASVFMGAMGLAFLLAPEVITGWFTPQPEHLALTPQLLAITGWVQVPFAVGIVLRSALRAAGDARVVMWITWVCTWAIRLPLAFIISGVDLTIWGVTIHNPAPFGNNGLPGLWIGLCSEIVLRGALFWGRFLQGAWKTKRV